MFMTGKYDFLSNFYPCFVPYKGITYSNSEAAFQAQKEKDPNRRYLYKDEPQNIAKRMGRRANLRPDWEQIKDQIMYEIVKSKFENNPDLIKRLLKVNEPIVEDNNWNDTYWGVHNGNGLNKLGKILEKVKSEMNDLNKQHKN